MSEVVFENVVKTFPAVNGVGLHHAVKDLSLTVASGELVTVCDQNPPYPVSLACIFPHKRLQDPKSRLFIEYMVAAIKNVLSDLPVPSGAAVA